MTLSASDPLGTGRTEAASARGLPSHPPRDPAPGKPPPAVQIPDHELLRCIGRGAYGAVWLARNIMGTLRAIKIIHREDFARDRPFTREYEGLLKFEPISRAHPNLMQILHVGRRDAYFYYVTELADDLQAMQKAEGSGPMGSSGSASSPRAAIGDRSSAFPYAPRTLQADLESRGRLPVRECVALAGALAAALKHLHDRGLVHRDVKPSNVIFVHGVPKLADIGLVTTAGDSRSIVGTEGYLPPEGPGSPQADLYALGILLYEVSTGMNRQDYPRLPQRLREWPDAAELLEFNEVLLRACARDVDRRYHRADDLLADLALLERGASVKRLRRLERHHAVLQRLGAGALAVGLILGTAWWQSWRAHRIARQHLAQLHLSQGTRHLVQGEYITALPWLVGALELDSGDPVRERAHRARLARVLERCPLPVAHFAVPASRTLAADLSPDGTLVATAHEDGEVRLWTLPADEKPRLLHHDFPVVFCQFLPSGNRMLTVTLGQKAFLWNLDEPGGAPLTFDQMVGFGSDSYAVGLNETFDRAAKPPGRAYLAKGSHRFARSRPLDGSPFEGLTFNLKLEGLGDTLITRSQVRRSAPDHRVLYADEFRDSPGTDALASGRDEPPAPLWGSGFILLEHTSVADEPGRSGQAIWDNLKVRRYPSGHSPTAWRMVDDFSTPRLDNWVHAAPTASRSSLQVLNGQMVSACENLPRDHIGWRCGLWKELFEVSPGHTLEVEVDLVSAQAPHGRRQVGLSWGRPQLSPFGGPQRTFLLQNRWLPLFWWDWTLRLWDAERGCFVAHQPGRPAQPLEVMIGRTTRDLDLSPDARFLACVLGGDEAASVWDLGSGLRVTGDGLNRSKPSGVRFSPDNRFLALSHANGLDLLSVGRWSGSRELSMGEPWTLPRFSPGGARLAAVRNDREVVVWDLSELAESPVVLAHELDVQRIVFSPDGGRLASSSADGMVRLWDVGRAEPIGSPFQGALMRFNTDGSRLLCLADERGDQGVWLWDLTRVRTDPLAVPPPFDQQTSATSADQALTAEIMGQEITLRTSQGQYAIIDAVRVPLSRVGFSDDGRFLVAESVDARAWTWDILTRTLAGPPSSVRFDPALRQHRLPSLLPETRDPDRLSDWVALLAGRRLDGAGGIVPVSEADRTRLLRKLQPARPEDFTTRETFPLRWHREQAEAAEQIMDWESATFHWERTLQIETKRRDPKAAGTRDPGIGSGATEFESRRGPAQFPDSHSALRVEPATVPSEVRLAYARQAVEAVRNGLSSGRSRWSVSLPRPPWATPNLLDLSAQYTLGVGERLGASPLSAPFRALASGVHNLCGTSFDVRGVLRLRRNDPVIIPVHQPCRRIHFLQAADRLVADAGTRGPIASYELTFASGEKLRVVLQNPEDMPPYAAGSFLRVSLPHWNGTSPELHCTWAWSGLVRGANQAPQNVFLTRTTWELPPNLRGDLIETLELKAESSQCAPLILAITVE